jgi:hypothetical protein
LHLELKFSPGWGGCVVLIWHENTCKSWLVVKEISSRRLCFAQTLLISSLAHTWCEPHDVVTEPIRKDTNSQKAR